MLEVSVEYLWGKLSDSIPDGTGVGDKSVNKRTEAELCDLFEQYVGGGRFLVDHSGQLCLFTGSHFARVSPESLTYIVKRVLSRLGVGLVYQKSSSKLIAEQCLLNLRTEKGMQFEPDRSHVIFRNCVLDVESGRRLAHSEEYRSDVYLDFDYEPNVLYALWDRVVMETIPDEGMRRAFQQFCGAFLADRERFKIEYICLMVGTGRNGKSVLCKAIADMFGDSLVTAYSPEQLFRSSQSMYNLADIDGKVANYADDVSNKDFSGGDFKQFISGAKFQARRIYGNPFTVTKVPLMLCCVNEIPPSTDDTNGYYRRLLPIVCPHVIADADVDIELPGKLSTEKARQAIFNWLYEGYQQLMQQRGKIEVCESIVNMRNDIREDANSARRWLRDRFRKSGAISFKDVMAEYMDYCKSFGELPKSGKSVSRILKEMGVSFLRRSDGMWCVFDDMVDEDRGIEGRIPEDTELPF